MTAEENEAIRDSIGNIDDLLWFIEHSELFKFHILGEASRFFLENEETIRRDIQYQREKKKKE
jgi:hypothetical protein